MEKQVAFRPNIPVRLTDTQETVASGPAASCRFGKVPLVPRRKRNPTGIGSDERMVCAGGKDWLSFRAICVGASSTQEFLDSYGETTRMHSLFAGCSTHDSGISSSPRPEC
jgi:hypothetical protein